MNRVQFASSLNAYAVLIIFKLLIIIMCLFAYDTLITCVKLILKCTGLDWTSMHIARTIYADIMRNDIYCVIRTDSILNRIRYMK